MELSIFLGQVIGVYLFAMGIVVIAYFHEIQEAMEEFMQSKMLYYLGSELIFVLGLLMVVSHTTFKGGILPIAVTIVSYMIVIKGATMLLLPHNWVGAAAQATSKRWVYVLGGVFMLLLGAFFIFMSFIFPLIDQ